MNKPAVKITALDRAAEALLRKDHPTLAGAPEGFDALALASIARKLAARIEAPAVAVFVSRDDKRMQRLENALRFTAPDIEVLPLPAWDCQPYDRASPNSAIVARRMTTLARLARTRSGEAKPRVVLTTINAALQRVPAKSLVGAQSFAAAPGNLVDTRELAAWLDMGGYMRASTVRETGEYAVRGGIVDLFPPGMPNPIRLDFFGDALESIRTFDPETQRSLATMRALDLVPVSETQLTSDTIRRFRQGYLAAFGTPGRNDTLYETVSEGRRFAGMEHWLPLFHERMDTVFDYVGAAAWFLDPAIAEVMNERLSQVDEYYSARKEAAAQNASGTPYNPLKPDALYLTGDEWRERLNAVGHALVTPFALPESDGRLVIDCGARQGRSFAAERAVDSGNVFDAVVAHIGALQAKGKRVLVAGWSEGSRERLAHVLADHGLKSAEMVGSLGATKNFAPETVGLVVWGLEQGFETGKLAVVGEQDILGDRLIRTKRASKKASDYITEAGSLTPGDLVVHVDHGIGRFIGLKTITAAGAPHDCLEIHYNAGDKLFLPVENIELLSRYGSEDTDIQLDRLGGPGWQARKAKMKQRIREIAGKLIQIAAARLLKDAPKIVLPDGLYDEFAARFPYDETEDQLNAIDAVIDDLGLGRPMDRLICGDVGFGKTEVALRAAFAVAMAGKQVAVVVPTTLLARQHHKTFAERFKGLPVKVGQASRFVGTVETKATKDAMADGTMDIVVGTHAILGKNIAFKDLGLVIVDEEQHFGVAHKERLKELRAEVHVLTLSATPIPRTLQLAMTGVRDLSIIATPPVDRLAVRTFVAPFDGLMVREALLRERYRGGQSFYVVPRIEDLAGVKDYLDKNVPECKVAIAHGQMAAGQLEDVMTAFYEGKFDILLSTTIVESGLDIPTANTLIVHRADMFGLSQLYQLRGRVGRAKTRAYALFTLHEKKKLTLQAERRLKVLQSLDTLGAGFQLASHDLDIRGAGNLLGDEQSGHIKEVGYELYQQMLEEAVASLKAGITDVVEDQWSPTITIGTPVMIPEHYVEDLVLRLGLYKRLSTLEDDAEIESFGAEMIDRFGPMPDEVRQLLDIVAIKVLCRRANIEKVEAGPKGIIVAFRDNSYANPDGLVAYVTEQGAATAKVRPDMKLVFVRDMEKPEQRLKGTTRLMRDLVRIAERKKAA